MCYDGCSKWWAVAGPVGRLFDAFSFLPPQASELLAKAQAELAEAKAERATAKKEAADAQREMAALKKEQKVRKHGAAAVLWEKTWRTRF